MGTTTTAIPIDPTQYIQGKDRYDRYTHEIRLASDAGQRLRFVAGAFLQRQEHDIQQVYKVDGLGSQITVTGWDDAIWLTKQVRVDKDWALFGELTYDFTDKLTGTVGARYFDSDNSLEGFFGYSEGYSSRAPARRPAPAATTPRRRTSMARLARSSTRPRRKTA